MTANAVITSYWECLNKKEDSSNNILDSSLNSNHCIGYIVLKIYGIFCDRIPQNSHITDTASVINNIIFLIIVMSKKLESIF